MPSFASTASGSRATYTSSPSEPARSAFDAIGSTTAASRAPATATITVPALVDRPLLTLDGKHKVTASGGSFTDSFGPLEARVYVAAPVQG